MELSYDQVSIWRNGVSMVWVQGGSSGARRPQEAVTGRQRNRRTAYQRRPPDSGFVRRKGPNMVGVTIEAPQWRQSIF